MGSPFLEPFLHKYSKLLAADYVLSADGGQISETQPAISLGHRRVQMGVDGPRGLCRARRLCR